MEDCSALCHDIQDTQHVTIAATRLLALGTLARQKTCILPDNASSPGYLVLAVELYPDEAAFGAYKLPLV